MSRIFMPNSPIHPKVRNIKSKRVLQVLQVSASDKDLLVSPNLMSGKAKKPEKSQKKTEVFKDELLSKENTPIAPAVRRSKRNAVAQDQVKKAPSKEGTETKASSNKVTKAKKAVTKKSKKTNSNPKQSKIDSFITSSSTSNTVFESKLENDESSVNKDLILEQSKATMEGAVSPSKTLASGASLQDSGISCCSCMLTSDNPTDNYWKILAEERRVALAEALRENEELCDQLEVLETDNSQLKGILNDAEKLAEILRQALE